MQPSNNSSASPADSLHGWLKRAARAAPDATALQGGGERLSYRELAEAVDGLASRLTGLVPAGSPLALAVASRHQTALAFHAVLRLGIPLLPLDPRFPTDARNRLLAAAGARILIDDRGVEPPPPGISRLDPHVLEAPATGTPEARRGRGDGSPIRLIIPTSGSGGEPKGVMLSADGLAAAVRASRQRIPLGPDDCWLACLPLFHIGGLAILLRCLEAGAAVLLHPRFDPQRVWRELAEQPITHLSLVPAMLHQLLQTAGHHSPPARLRVLLVGGAALDPAVARRAHDGGWPLCVTYGMSETASQLATWCGPGAGLEPGRVGHPLAGMEVRIDAPDHTGTGRIRVRGPALMAGYVNPLLRPGDGLRQGWFHTGDLGRLEADGNLRVLGRADEMLISGGEQVHPAQVEAVLGACPGVAAAALSTLADPQWGERLVAVYAGSAVPAAVEDWCRQRLAGPWLPRTFLQVLALPVTGPGKPDRNRLRRLVARRIKSD